MVATTRLGSSYSNLVEIKLADSFSSDVNSQLILRKNTLRKVEACNEIIPEKGQSK